MADVDGSLAFPQDVLPSALSNLIVTLACVLLLVSTVGALCARTSMVELLSASRRGKVLLVGPTLGGAAHTVAAYTRRHLKKAIADGSSVRKARNVVALRLPLKAYLRAPARLVVWASVDDGEDAPPALPAAAAAPTYSTSASTAGGSASGGCGDADYMQATAEGASAQPAGLLPAPSHPRQPASQPPGPSAAAAAASGEEAAAPTLQAQTLHVELKLWGDALVQPVWGVHASALAALHLHGSDGLKAFHAAGGVPAFLRAAQESMRAWDTRGAAGIAGGGRGGEGQEHVPVSVVEDWPGPTIPAAGGPEQDVAHAPSSAAAPPSPQGQAEGHGRHGLGLEGMTVRNPLAYAHLRDNSSSSGNLHQAGAAQGAGAGAEVERTALSPPHSSLAGPHGHGSTASQAYGPSSATPSTASSSSSLLLFHSTDAMMLDRSHLMYVQASTGAVLTGQQAVAATSGAWAAAGGAAGVGMAMPAPAATTSCTSRTVSLHLPIPDSIPPVTLGEDNHVLLALVVRPVVGMAGDEAGAVAGGKDKGGGTGSGVQAVVVMVQLRAPEGGAASVMGSGAAQGTGQAQEEEEAEGTGADQGGQAGAIAAAAAAGPAAAAAAGEPLAQPTVGAVQPQAPTPQPPQAWSCSYEVQPLVLAVLPSRSVAVGDVYCEGMVEGAANSSGASSAVPEPQCVVCLSDTPSILLLPCRHLAVCGDCHAHLDKCPVCRARTHGHMVVPREVLLGRGRGGTTSDGDE